QVGTGEAAGAAGLHPVQSPPVPADSVPPPSSAGCLCTVGVLTYGLISFKRGHTRRSQLLMRARILAQGFTFAALLGGMVVTAMKARK
uniref:HIG1 domain-containing protein n=1 Tax=Anas platyrhynchos platyrhynchos TaxID=8840 RepID=U3HYL0_ANAPP